MLVTAEKDGGKYKVVLDGTDISEICHQANDTEGWADVLIKLSDNQFLGQKQSGKFVLTVARITGDVAIVKNDPDERITMLPKFTVDINGKVIRL